jgi:3-oxoacyl-[acyl-carrier protein] reductase
MDLKLAGKTALITGASKGIGGAAAEMLAAEGCHLVLVARTAGDLARAKESISRKANVSVETVTADLADSANVTRLAREFSDIDILVNNAGAIPGASCSTSTRRPGARPGISRSSATSTCAGRSTR